MIIVRFSSGLGNQMYQYNFYRMLKKRYPDTEVKVDLTWFYANNDHYGYELKRIFGQSSVSDFMVDEATKSEIFKVTGQIPPLVKGPLAKKVVFLEGPVNRILREHSKNDKSQNHIDQLNGDISNYYEVNEAGKSINPLYEFVMNLDVSKDWYFTGFWIEEHYYKSRVLELKREFIFPEITDSENADIAAKMNETNSVSIHVRRGDYLSATYSGMFKSLGEEYYKNAVSVIREKITSPHFFIFSDDAEYISKAFEWLPDKTIVDVNRGKNSYKDMQLMTYCKHNIIANSTFSQWGAILNKNTGNITIYPAAYLADEDTEVKTLPGWTRV